MINKCIKFIQSLIFPQSCLVCNQLTQRPVALCDSCEQELPYNRECCQVCAIPLPASENLYCASCQTNRPAYDFSHIPLLYREPVNHWIQHFKFNSDLVKAKALSDLFFSSLHAHEFSSTDALIPVPLHASRIRKRGFNQALWLAKQISQLTGIPVDNRLVKRHKKTRPQHELKHRQRLNNLKGAFVLAGPCRYKKVIIIDDVVTTGTTVNEIARLLKIQGVDSVHVWAIARTAKTKSH